jgi:NAD(P)-dependent dehydrogenase (short-subunit alcohol dehydrogenase family)
VAAALQRELALEGSVLEVSWVRQRRRTVQALARRTRVVAGASPNEGGNWIVTGGARGITFAVAREMARQYGLTLHLLGSSQYPQVDDATRQAFAAGPKDLRARTIREARELGADPNVAWRSLEHSLEIDRNLQALQAEGIRATYHTCDVANGEALAHVLDEIRRVDGPIHGVLHGAGVEDASKFARKRLERVEATLNVKVGGALHLIRLLAEDPLEHFIGFGSISGRFGNTGQSDYSMASDWLAKVVGRLRTERPTVRATTFHWPAWDEVGMAARPESRVVLEAAGSRFLPLAEGCTYVIAELEAGCPEAEVLIVEETHHYLQGLPPAKASRARSAAERRAADFPMLAGVRSAAADQLVADAVFNPSSDVFLKEHQLAGVPILPGVVGIELLAEAASVLMRKAPVGLTDVEFVSGMRFDDGRLQAFQVVARRASGRVHCEVIGDFFNRSGCLTLLRHIFDAGIRISSDRL